VIYAPPLLPLLFVAFFVLLVFMVLVVEFHVLAYAYRKIGIRPRWVAAILLASLVGSQVNIPLYAVNVTNVAPPQVVWRFGRPYEIPQVVHAGTTVVALNVGGALIPMLVSLYLFLRLGLRKRMIVATAIVAVIVHSLAQIVPGVGIAVPMLVPPLAAAGIALVLSFRRAPPVAYVSGSMGALLGADIWNLPRIADLGAPIVSIGGAGTFDGVFLTGILAGLIA
jgi:uncharacterized membrane protein